MEWFRYFRLLMWKNFLIKWRHKLEFCVEIILPLIFFSIIVAIRTTVYPTDYDKPTFYSPVPIGLTSLDLLRTEYASTVSLWEIDYTPPHPLLDKLIANVALELGLNYRSFANPTELEKFMMSNQSFVGVVFDQDTSQDSLPQDFTYRLRFPAGLRTVSVSASINTWDTSKLFPPRVDTQGPRNKDSNAGGDPGYILEGFMAVQNAISSNYIKLAATSNATDLPDIELQRFPYPPYIDDPIIEWMQPSVGILIVLAFMFPCVQAIKHITVEKDQQLKEAMKIMGLSTALHWFAWFVTIMVSLLILVAFLLIFFKINWFDGSKIAIFTRSSWSLLLVVFLIYSMSCVTFCFMISSFFTRAKIAGPIGALCWFITYIPFAFTSTTGTQLPFGANMALSIFLNTACPLACNMILTWEGLAIGAQWSNLFEGPNIGDDYSVGSALVMMIVDGIVYMLIALYVEKILPGEYGVALKWYFPLTKSYWFPNSDRNLQEEIPPVSPGYDDDQFEPEIGGQNKVGIQVINLRKHFGEKIAVDGLNVKMYENQITVLLGHNGAGKTTTISMITGLIPPTGGTAIVNGYNMRTHFPEIRKQLGFCPQYNILFNELTVEEHIVFYSLLKGVPSGRVKEEVHKYLKILGLEDKRKAQSCTLSGGMKRKLSMGIALCGDSKVVLCDEPSAGMDPAARRDLWELLLNEKKGRTVLLTTHLMDEADVLGDRIAIMSEGKLKCSGSPFFLKRRFGTGYKLICSKQQDCNTESVIAMVKSFIPEATIKSEVGMELTFQLPEKYSHVFEPMLRKLETDETSYGLTGYGISMTTLEDVFLKTGTEMETNGSKVGSSQNGSSSTVQLVDPLNIDCIPIVSHTERIRYQWQAMFYKKAINITRNWHLLALQLAVPVLFIVLGYCISEVSEVIGGLPPLTISLNSYGYTQTLLRNEAPNGSFGSEVAQNYKEMFQTFPPSEVLTVINGSIQNTILGLSEYNIRYVNRRYLVAATIEANRTIGWFNNQALHTAPLTLNLIYNAIARTVLGPNYKITVINDPLPLSTNYQLNQLKGAGSLGFQLALNTSFAMAYVSSIFIMFLITERVSRAKLLQFVSGARLTIFWAVHFVCDFIVFIFVACLAVVIMYAMHEEGFRTGPQLGRMFLIFLLYGFSSIPLTYLVSFFFEEPATGLARLSLIHIITGDALFIMAFVLSIMNDGDTVGNIAVIFPNFAIAQSISNQAMIATSESICASIAHQTGITVEEVCTTLSSSCCNLDPFAWDSPGIGRPLAGMFGIGCLLFAILILRERRQASSECCTCSKPPPPQESQAEIDEDVLNEKRKVAMMEEPEIARKNLVMRNISKYYKSFLAVNKVSVSVSGGDCFGLLGVNGAGKTSAFKMMTGDESISYGDIWVEGHNIQKERLDVYDLIGYCPQYDALLMDFTGLETLRLIATLRGIPKDLIQPLSEQLAIHLAFEKHLYKKVKDYSGGNRRKLSTAVALLGNPHLVFLDEPTAGVDPASRRKIWDMICHIRDIGKAIILTSHSMEECEALCTRIAIMVNGEFKCIGSAQHLKNKFSPGITLTIKLSRIEDVFIFDGVDISDLGKSANGSNTSKVIDFVNQNFPGAELKDYHKNLLTFELPGNAIPYSKIFGLMEENKKALCIEDYTLSQGTLEQVFLSFTNSQRDAPSTRL